MLFPLIALLLSSAAFAAKDDAACSKLWKGVRPLSDAYEEKGGEPAARRLIAQLPRLRETGSVNCDEFGWTIRTIELGKRRARDREAGKAWAIELDARLLRTSDGGWAEDLSSGLGAALEKHPRAFLRAWRAEYGDEYGCGPASNLGTDGVDQERSWYQARYRKRIRGLEAVRDAKLRKLRDACLASLRGALARE